MKKSFGGQASKDDRALSAYSSVNNLLLNATSTSDIPSVGGQLVWESDDKRVVKLQSTASLKSEKAYPDTKVRFARDFDPSQPRRFYITCIGWQYSS